MKTIRDVPISECKGEDVWPVKFVRKIKRDAVTKRTRLRSRMCVITVRMKKGEHYWESFAFTCKWQGIKIVITVVVAADWVDVHGDMTQAFQLTKLSGRVPMRILCIPPKGHGRPGHYWELQNCAQGTPPSMTLFQEDLNANLAELDFHPVLHDAQQFVHAPHYGKVQADGHHPTPDARGSLHVHVDDIFGGVETPELREKLATGLAKCYPGIKFGAWGELGPTLGFEVARDRQHRIARMTAKKAINDLTSTYLKDDPAFAPAMPWGAAAVNMTPTPMPDQHDPEYDARMTMAEGDRTGAGKMVFISKCRGDILTPLNKCCQYLHRPTSESHKALKHVGQYLRSTIDRPAIFGHPSITSLEDLMITSDDYTNPFRHDHEINGYHYFTDGDLSNELLDGSEVQDKCSTLGTVHMFGRGCINDTSRKQPSVAKNTHESEIMAKAAGDACAIPTRATLTAIGIPQTLPTPAFVDNDSCRKVSKNITGMKKSLHTLRNVAFSQECEADGEVKTCVCGGEENAANIKTKLKGITKEEFLDATEYQLNINLRERGPHGEYMYRGWKSS